MSVDPTDWQCCRTLEGGLLCTEPLVDMGSSHPGPCRHEHGPDCGCRAYTPALPLAPDPGLLMLAQREAFRLCQEALSRGVEFDEASLAKALEEQAGLVVHSVRLNGNLLEAVVSWKPIAQIEIDVAFTK